MEFMTSWEKRGWQRGKKEGRREVFQEMLLRQLQFTLGPLSESLEARLQKLSLKQLDQLNLDLPDFGTATDLEAWLEKHASPSASHSQPTALESG